MPAKDLFHDAVKNALIKDGWTITDDPLTVEFGEKSFYVDLGAEKLFAAEKQGRKIAVEVKSFVSLSLTYEFHTALGQFLNYQMFLENVEPERTLYLAVPSDAYTSFFQKEAFVQASIARHKLKLIICNIEREEIVEWQG